MSQQGDWRSISEHADDQEVNESRHLGEINPSIYLEHATYYIV